ncbi:heavy metal-associated isoprenylated plant protein 47-like [Miscanthus floridulus]|uniref:heavy metal-associated isoprenylated plant protein 47-like n=1 Tax=Miscanthus floridulus TaxID=154761 RepID=UPI0034580BD7
MAKPTKVKYDVSDNEECESDAYRSDDDDEEYTKEDLMDMCEQQKIVIKVQMSCDKCRSKAMAVVAATGGVDSVAIDGEGRDKVVVMGEGVDSTKLTSALRKKVGRADLLHVSEVKKDDKKPPPAAAAAPSNPTPQPQPVPPLLPPDRLLVLLLRLLDAAGHHLLQPP